MSSTTNLELKSLLLSHGQIRVTHELLDLCETNNLSLARAIRMDNLYSYPWLFLRLSDNCHVRMVAVPDSASLELCLSKQGIDRYDIYNSETDYFIAYGLKLETVVRHCPEQLFYSLYKSCNMGCKFCPYPFASPQPKIDINTILMEVERLGDTCTGIGFTSGIPVNVTEDDVALEMAQLCRDLKSRINPSVRIGASPKQPTQMVLSKLMEAGIDELRINLEVYNFNLAQMLMPKKDIKRTLQSISDAVQIFGRGKVSSNIILGIGETDDDVITGITELAKLGAIATLYPYDPVPACDKLLSKLLIRFGRPNKERLLHLAREHQKILLYYGLIPNYLTTMCPGCGASHIMPGKDL